jgi:DNA-binding response OmpR family regulator
MRKTILLADDSPTIQRLVTQTFAEGEFDVVSVSNGDAAIKKFEELRPSLVIADIYMPGKNGYEVCAHVKQHASRGGTPVILLVGAFDAYDEATGTNVGASSRITKPFEPQALVTLVKSLVTDAPAPADPAASSSSVAEQPDIHAEDTSDLLGLESLFKEPPTKEKVVPAVVHALTDAEIERIADRVIKKLSPQIIENIAWDVVPEITERIVREELKKSR